MQAWYLASLLIKLCVYLQDMVWLLVRVCIDNTVGVHCERENPFHFTSTGAVKATTKSSKDLDYSWVIIGFNSCKVDRWD